MDGKSVYYEVRSVYLNVILMKFSHQRVKTVQSKLELKIFFRNF